MLVSTWITRQASCLLKIENEIISKRAPVKQLNLRKPPMDQLNLYFVPMKSMRTLHFISVGNLYSFHELSIRI